MFYTHPGERVERGSCEPARPVQASCCEDDMPGQPAQFTAEYASFAGPPGSPEGASKTGRRPPPPAMPPAASPAGSGTVPGPGYADGSAAARRAADGKGRPR